MIIPWLKGFLLWDKAPIAWAIIFTNIMIYLMTAQVHKSSYLFTQLEDIVLTGRLYDQYQFQKNLQFEKSELKTTEEYILLGSQGLKDPEFIRLATDLNFTGDAVAIAKWKNEIQEFHQMLQKRMAYKFGLVADRKSVLSWITYQFMHAGFFHLLSNMALLLIFAAVLESMIGGFYLILIYLLCGVAGGAGFMLLSGSSLAPMIGASGAVSGVMACYAVLEKKKRVPFFYFLSPMQGYFGIIYLPTFLIFPLCFLTDVASFLSTPKELGDGVAYTAHIGGAVCGILIALFFKFLRWEQILGGAYSRSRSGAQ